MAKATGNCPNGLNIKRMSIALILSAVFGVFCARGAASVQIPGLVVTYAVLLATFYNRLLIGLVIGLAGSIHLIKGELANAALRGAISGVLVSLALATYGGLSGLPLVAFGLVYGIITDVAATKYG